ncbi:putative glycoside hydrolase [Tieghemostelium lacteum]|uniref:Putative glycoside hydrolase n=1 Tax=Tieghemostelium lacteum TaxID=361077 RepID=A0A151ZJL8_TIELA|nr:putative glycoside hydrolase [Tieghemostelium lacteum]|eukprot:KYQ94099.1 putative glycoside hydrolase [Tieghemostelium lacteum]
MSEPINHKQLAKASHKGSHKNSFKDKKKYKKEEYEQKKKERLEQSQREQDPNFQSYSDEEEEQIDQSKKHHRSKYSKRLLVQKEYNSVEELEYYDSHSQLNMQDLLDSKVDFIPKFDKENEEQDIESKQTQNSINVGEIEKLLLSFPIYKRLNINQEYFKNVELSQQTGMKKVQRKSNKHLQTSNTKSQPTQTNSTKKENPTPVTTQSPPPTTSTSTEVKKKADNENLEDWLDSII